LPKTTKEVYFQSIAENTAAALGHLKKSDMSCFQIMAQNSSEDYSYGGFFTNSKKQNSPDYNKISIPRD
jgi:hypothetical protein